MELDLIKLQTTWNDAASSLNTNFSKIKMALASRQGGGESPVIGGIVVNGMPYTDDDGDGFITLPDYPKKLSALENDLNLGSFAYKNALAVSDIPDLSGKYLPLSGGQMTGDSEINWSGTSGIWGTNNGLFLRAPLLQRRASNGNYYTILDSGNYSSYALPLTGGTLTGTLTLSKEGSDVFVINRLNSSSPTTITYRKDSSLLGRMGFDASTKEPVAQVLGTYQTLLHSGNVGSYNAGSATKLATPRTIWGQSFDGTGNVSGNLFLNNASYIRTYLADGTSSANIMGVNASNNLLIAYGLQTTGKTGIYGKEIYFAPNGEVTKMLINSSGNVTIGGSDLAGTSAKLYVDGHITTSNNKALFGKDTSGNLRQLLVLDNGNDFVLGYGASGAGYNTYLEGNNIYLRYGTSHTAGLILNSSGNVTIGDTDRASTNYKLFVKGNAMFLSGVHLPNGTPLYTQNASGTNKSAIYMDAYDNFLIGNNSMLITSSGNVLIGTTTDNGAKLQVNGGISATGQISTAHSLVFNGDYGIWKGNRFTGSLTENDIAYNAAKYVFFNGNVGIGTISPAYKLDVAGTGRFTGKTTHDGGIDIPNGQQLAFLDASGNRHTIAWDSASNGILIDGNLIVLGELATGLPMQEIPSIPEIGV